MNASDLITHLSHWLVMHNVKDNVPVVVMCSGGEDSQVLLWALSQCIPGHLIHAFYVDHQLRHDTHQDLQSIHQLAKELGCHCHSKSLPVSQWADREGVSFEMAGHFMRQKWGSHLARLLGAQNVFTGHHQDDHIER